MIRVLVPVLVLILMGVAVGFVLGIMVGVFVLPVTFSNTGFASLRPAQKDDYVVMVSAAYALDNSLPDAKQRLARLDSDQGAAAKYVADVAQRAIDKDDTRNARNLAALAIALGAGTPALEDYMSAAASPTATPLPTFTATPAATAKPAALLEETATPPPAGEGTNASPAPSGTTAKATSTRSPAATSGPPTATFTARPPTATPVPPTPTDTPKPAVDFKVIEQRLMSINEAGGCYGNNLYRIKTVDKNSNPINGILVRRVFTGNDMIPATGFKGPGLTEDTPPRYSGDKLYVLGDASGARFTSDVTRSLDENPKNIAISELIAAGYCPNNPTVCQQSVNDGSMCEGHFSYSVVFQRQW